MSELLERYQHYRRECAKAVALWRESGCQGVPQLPDRDPEFAELRCLARTAKGSQCKSRAITADGFCQMHRKVGRAMVQNQTKPNMGRWSCEDMPRLIPMARGRSRRSEAARAAIERHRESCDCLIEKS